MVDSPGTLPDLDALDAAAMKAMIARQHALIERLKLVILKLRRRSSDAGRRSFGEVPGQQLVDAVDGVVRDPSQHSAEIEFRVEAVELCCADQSVDGRGAFSALVRTSEEIVFSSERDGAQRTFGAVVVDLDAAVVDVAHEGAPAARQIA